MKMIWSGWESKGNCHVLVNQSHWNIPSRSPSCRQITSIFRDVKWCFNASWGLKGLSREFTIVIFIHQKSRIISQKSICNGCRWLLEVSRKWKKWLLWNTVPRKCFKTPRCRTLSHSSEIQSYALMHSEGWILVAGGGGGGFGSDFRRQNI